MRIFMILFAPGFGLAYAFCWLFDGFIRRIFCGGQTNESDLAFLFLATIFFNIVFYLGVAAVVTYLFLKP